MPRRPSLARRWRTALIWPAGIALTSWDYMWRITALHRSEMVQDTTQGHLPPSFPEHVDQAEVQAQGNGHGPLFHRRYAVRIADAELDCDHLMARLTADLNRAAPRSFARFQKVLGDGGQMSAGDEYVVRMPGPWDGPVRVVERRPGGFRLATLAGHLEAGEIEFRVTGDGRRRLTFEIESWARSSNRLSHVLYHRLRMAKEVQLHMWVSFLEGVVALAGGRMHGGVVVKTVRVHDRT